MRSGASAPGAILGWCRARCAPGIGRIGRLARRRGQERVRRELDEALRTTADSAVPDR